MRFARKERVLSDPERHWAKAVFQDSLPSWERIKVTDAMGPIPGYDKPYTDEVMRMFVLNVGPDYYPDMDNDDDHDGWGRGRAVLIHELTHVWQFYHGYWVALRSFWANVPGKGYYYTLEESDAWDDFNVEQQASIVEHWFTRGMQINDDRFTFIDKIIRPGITGGFWADIRDNLLIQMPLKQLRDFDP
jgi:hypothetical protein